MRILTWVRHNSLFAISLFLLAFIPLYPKIPLFDILPGYIVRVRVEDLLVLLAGGVWLYHSGKNKSQWRNGYLGLVGLYALSGLISIILGIILLQTIPFELLHIGKSALHYFRYLEYFSLFFIVFSGISSKKQTKIALFVLTITTFLVTLYGMGQKYAHLPLYSTMNREYSKGKAFYLHAGDKVSSTFGGHYDLAAFLVISLPLIFSFSLSVLGKRKKNAILFLWLQFTHWVGVWLLVETGSKTALISYLVAMMVVIVMQVQKIPNRRLKKIVSVLALLSVIVMVFTFISLFGKKTKARFENLFHSVFSAQQSANPADLVGNGYEWKIHTSTSPDGVVTTTRKLEKSTWSPNALRYGISLGIRLDTLWPQALKGLSSNPLFGSGYGTLAKLENAQFTEADSTDNNYLRTLGETGLIGFVSFYGLVLLSMWVVKKNLKNHTGILSALGIGYLGASAGLLINALYIDVFAASKVAFIFWALAGLTLKMLAPRAGNQLFTNTLSHINRHKTLYLAIILAFFLLQQNPLATNSQLNSFSGNNKTLENFVAARCFVKTHNFNLCRASGLQSKNSLSGYGILLLPLVFLSSNPVIFYYLNFSLVLFVLIFAYKKLHIDSAIGLLLLVFIAYEYRFTSNPLEDWQLVRLLVLAPIAIWLLQKFLLCGKHARVSKIILLASFFLIPLVHPGFAAQFVESFRNLKPIAKRDAVLQADANLKKVDSKKNNYLISVLSPFYIDLYSSHQYQILPLSEQQTYMDTPQSVWGSYDFSNLHSLYSRLLGQGNRLFLSDYGITTSKNFHDDFASLRHNFDVRYTTIDCYDQCSLFTVSKLSEKISPLPKTLSRRQLEPNALADNITFAVINNHYGFNVPYTPTDFLAKLQTLKQSAFDFVILSGELAKSPDQSTLSLFQNSFAEQTNYPVLYNLDSVGEKFYSNSNYFLTLNLNSNSQASTNQRLFAYNSLLELEQLANIKNLFVIAPNLNWQDRSDPSNFLFSFEKKLANFPNLQIYIFTADHAKNEIKSRKNTNINYYANMISGTKTDSYLKIFTNQSKNVKIEQTSLP